MASEKQREALAKARSAKVTKTAPMMTEADAKISEAAARVSVEEASQTVQTVPAPVNLQDLARHIEEHSHTVYKARRLYVIAAFVPGVEGTIIQTIFGGVTVRPSDTLEFMLSNGERIKL